MSDVFDDALRQLVARGVSPGIQYARVDSEGRIRSYSAGWAAPGERCPMTEATALMAYSMTKVLTAEAVALLAKEGKLSLDDPLAWHLPHQPYGNKVTLRQLLEHRGGVPNPIPLRWVHPAAEHSTFDETAALAAVLRRYPRPTDAPGTRTRYSNLGYWLLGQVVERVAGVPFSRFVSEQLLRPAGILPREIDFTFPADGNRARGYLKRFSFLRLALPFLTDRGMTEAAEGRWLRVREHYVNGPAFGGAIGTARGFCRFAWYLLEHGDSGFGWNEKATHAEKEGGGAGFRGLIRLDRRRKKASVVMANSTSFPVRAFLDRMDAIGG